MKLNFKLYGQGGAIVAIDHLMQKSCGLVAVGDVIAGSVSEGETVALKRDDRITKNAIFSQIKRIEINYEKVNSADEGQAIGICLDNVSKEDLIKYFE